jgi:hypothetical protein
VAEVVEAARIMNNHAQFYVPEELTPLFFTPSYARLTEPQKISYNRLHGLYFLEQTIFFEQCQGKPGLLWLSRHAPSEELKREAADFLAEEDAHSTWFRALLREVEPGTYAHTDFHRIGATKRVQWLTRKLGAGIAWLPALLWLQLMAEERALHFGRCYVRHAGQIDPRFLAVQRRHLADEPGHVRRDVLFIEWLWPATPAWLRRINARFLEWLLREFFHLPKHSGKRVVMEWLSLHPELEPQRSAILDDWRQLGCNPDFLHSLYPRAALPKTAALASDWPELSFLKTFLTD